MVVVMVMATATVTGVIAAAAVTTIKVTSQAIDKASPDFILSVLDKLHR